MMDFGDINAAVERMQRELPGWWWSVGWCQVSSDASIAPHGDGADIYLVYVEGEDRFNSGFHQDIGGTNNVAASLHAAIDEAIEAKRCLSAEQHTQAREAYQSDQCKARMVRGKFVRDSDNDHPEYGECHQ